MNESSEIAYLIFAQLVDSVMNNNAHLGSILKTLNVPDQLIELFHLSEGKRLVDLHGLYPGGSDGVHQALVKSLKKHLFGVKPHRIYLEPFSSVNDQGKLTRDMLGIIHYMNKYKEKYLDNVDLLEEVESELIPIADAKWFMPRNGHIPIQLTKEITVIFESRVEQKSVKKDDERSVVTDVRQYKIELFSWVLSASEMIDFVHETTKLMEAELSEILKSKSYFYTHLRPDVFERYEMPISNKTWRNTFFKGASEIETVIENFVKNGFDDIHHAHHLGIGIFGKPGNGKTSAIKSILNQCRKLGQPRQAVMVNFNNIKTVEQLNDIFYGDQLTIHGKLKQNERLYVFEDIDTAALVSSREIRNNDGDESATAYSDYSHLLANSVSDGMRNLINDAIREKLNDSITLGDLLNVLDGPVECPGRIIVMTSNYPEVIDPALLRPGRIDIRVDLDGARKEDIIAIINTYFETTHKVSQVTVEDYALSNAQVMNLCRVHRTSSANPIHNSLKVIEAVNQKSS